MCITLARRIACAIRALTWAVHVSVNCVCNSLTYIHLDCQLGFEKRYQRWPSCSHVSSTRQRELRVQFVLSGCVISRVQFVISRKIADTKTLGIDRKWDIWFQVWRFPVSFAHVVLPLISRNNWIKPSCPRNEKWNSLHFYRLRKK